MLSSGLPGGSQVTSSTGDALAVVEPGAGVEGRLGGHGELGVEPAAAPHSPEAFFQAPPAVLGRWGRPRGIALEQSPPACLPWVSLHLM